MVVYSNIYATCGDGKGLLIEFTLESLLLGVA